MKYLILMGLLLCRLASSANTSDTTKSNEFLRLGIQEFRAKEFSKAIREFSKAIKENSNNWRAYRYRGDAKDELNDFKSSIADYNKALQLHPFDTLAYHGRAEAKRHSADYQNAVIDYDVALKWNPNDTYLRLGRALCKFDFKEYRATIEDLNIFMSEWKEKTGRLFFLALKLRGAAYYHERQFREAIDDFKHSVKLGDNREDLLTLGKSYYFLRDTDPTFLDSAIYNYQLAKPVDKFNLHCLLGEAYSEKGDLELAEAELDKALVMKSKDPNALYLLATVMLRQRKFDSGYDLFRQYLEVVKEPRQGIGYLYWGIAKWGAKQDTAAAFRDFEKASELGGVERGIFSNQFLLLFGNPKYFADTKKYIAAEISTRKDSLKLSYLYASLGLLNAQTNDSTEARLNINTALDFARTKPIPIIYLIAGELAQQQGRDPKVVMHNYDKAISLNSKFGEAYMMKAYFFRKHNELDSACDNLTKARELGMKVTDTLNDYICNGKLKINSKESALNFVLYPYLRNTVPNLR